MACTATKMAIATATVKGIKDLPWSTLKASAPALFAKKGEAVPLSPKEFHYAFANTLTEVQSDGIRDRYHVPGSTTVLHERAFANFHRDAPTKVDFHREGRAPLLFIGFEEDHIVPPKAIRHNEEKYDNPDSITEYKEFAGRPHFPAVPGWEEVADYPRGICSHRALPASLRRSPVFRHRDRRPHSMSHLLPGVARPAGPGSGSSSAKSRV